ncbi:regulator of microtubule dynamics protein 2-like protein [Dinothrombium tinctorium]|uniref:Regulator of microtubule dynamics protein 1 n=1 Tax=Dinothrombium tinctorium TaxID=1965070 RepID=A0A3S3S1R2_9ACAR|nr:regulator of microtubule dynamics protein 2-like protein [Dinothrombium tinctorium]
MIPAQCDSKQNVTSPSQESDQAPSIISKLSIESSPLNSQNNERSFTDPALSSLYLDETLDQHLTEKEITPEFVQERKSNSEKAQTEPKNQIEEISFITETKEMSNLNPNQMSEAPTKVIDEQQKIKPIEQVIDKQEHGFDFQTEDIIEIIPQELEKSPQDVTLVRSDKSLARCNALSREDRDASKQMVSNIAPEEGAPKKAETTERDEEEEVTDMPESSFDLSSLSLLENFSRYIDRAANDPAFDRYFIYMELRQYLITHGVNSDLLWRLSRAAFDLSELAKFGDDENDRAKFLEEALNFGQQALNLDDKNPNCHQWFAVSLFTYLLDFCKNPNELRQKAEQFVGHINFALQLKPNDAYLHFIYGRWLYEWSRVGWKQRMFARIRGSKLPKASLESAISEFEIANKINPGWKLNSLYFAKSLIAKKRYSEAVKVLQVCLKLQNFETNELNGESESLAEREMQDLLNKYAKYDLDNEFN